MQEGGDGASGGFRRRSLSPDGVLNGLCGVMEGGPSGEVRDIEQEHGAKTPAEKLFSLRFVSCLACAHARVHVRACASVCAHTHSHLTLEVGEGLAER